MDTQENPQKAVPEAGAAPGQDAGCASPADAPSAGALAPADAALAPADAPDAAPATGPAGAAALAPAAPEELVAAPAEQDPARPVVLVMHASVGSGHRSAAEAVAQAFELLRDDPAHGGGLPDDLDVRVLDILDFGRVPIDGNATASMFTGVTRPFYDLTWRYTLTGRLLWGGGTIWVHAMFPRFADYVRECRPAAVVATHITAANVAVGARMLTGQDFPIVCVPTDYEVEGMWPHRKSDLFCVANEYMAETLRPRGVPEERILITGIPTRPAFGEDYDRDAVRASLGLPSDRRVVLALAGAHLPRPYVHFRDALDKLLPYLHSFEDMHLVVVAGKDAAYADHVRRQCEDYGLANVTVLEYVDAIAALMAASDLIICKSGGLTVTECLCARVPMVLMGRAYGQENANVRMLTASGAALHVTTARELLDTLRHIDAHPASTDAMLINASFLRKPAAALDIARATWQLAESDEPPDPRTRRKRLFDFYWGRKPAHIR
ncbi:MGDG synthase family glycosyltransferase [Adlercreutzia faecimuris]|uniref:UDP-N-acetylglucosamine 2-epimerase n=1 Tax=Adlercreutzia faecimuris TaxID=2897341 RepID=A0ABS9WI47_9ACTN|nr:glycosyltransferase [Adlercreutzia sp. JBNU-10]MCI2242220.1 UDP-N-acetylglucosamine 2-epimerase [Adlercreutzia sp. JBNU-10]